MNKAAITGIGGYVPDHVLSNKDLEKIVDTTDEWITSRTGIKERRILNDSKKATSYLAIKAAKNLIKKKKLNPESIDLVIVATITPDLPVAATAPYVASQIGAKNAFAYDLQAACSGFLYGMSSAVSYINSGRYKKVLLIGADKMSSIVDFKDRATCVLFGDGGGAVLFEKSKNNFGWEDEFFRSNGEDRMALKIKAGGSLFPTTSESYNNGWHNIYQDGKTVFKYAVSEMSYVTEQIFKRNNLNNENVNFLVPHQANKRIIDATIDRINISQEKVLMNISNYGNTTAATIPLLLYDYESKFKLGDNLVFSAFGGGFTWGSSYLTWAY